MNIDGLTLFRFIATVCAAYIVVAGILEIWFNGKG